MQVIQKQKNTSILPALKKRRNQDCQSEHI